MLIMIVIQVITAFLFVSMGYFISRKKVYWLLSGFNLKSKEEQEELIKNGYPQAAAKGITYSGYILLGGILFYFLRLPYAVELSWGIMMIYLFGHLLYISKLDAEKSRKANKMILIVTIILTVSIMGGVFFLGAQANHLTVKENTMTISGSYGVEWSLDEITQLELVDELPKILLRTNGYSTAARAKGKFRLEDLGSGLLFIHRHNPPYIFVKRGDDYLFINSSDSEETMKWYHELKTALEMKS